VPTCGKWYHINGMFAMMHYTNPRLLYNVYVVVRCCRSRLRGMHYGTLEQQKGAMKHVGGSGETYMEVRRQLLKVVLCSFFYEFVIGDDFNLLCYSVDLCCFCTTLSVSATHPLKWYVDYIYRGDNAHN